MNQNEILMTNSKRCSKLQYTQCILKLHDFFFLRIK